MSPRVIVSLWIWVTGMLLMGFGSTGLAFGQKSGVEVTTPTTYQLKITLRVEAGKQNLTRVKATCPIPVDWREQKVKLLSETLPRGSKSREQSIKGMGALWVLESPRLRVGQSLEAVRVYEIQRFQVVTNLDSKELKRPRVRSREIRQYLVSTPGIGTTDRDLQKLAEELGGTEKSAWEFTQAATDWIRRNVKYQLGPYRGAEFAYKQRVGDCEDLSALLIALCRISKIPARTVWVEGHAYPEFYLEDAAKKGYWIPVQLHGPEAFGNLNEANPILQKGDQYRDPVTRKTVRYLPQQVIAYGGQAKLAISRSIQKQNIAPKTGETTPPD